jgi:DNA-binding FrmR family transcriptional regulator
VKRPQRTPLVLDEETREVLVARLRRIEGQVRGLVRMLEEGRSCAEVAQQLGAARAALDRVALDLLRAGLEQCLREELAGNPQARSALTKLQRAFLTLR